MRIGLNQGLHLPLDCVSDIYHERAANHFRTFFAGLARSFRGVAFAMDWFPALHVESRNVGVSIAALVVLAVLDFSACGDPNNEALEDNSYRKAKKCG